jgi:hypothetical protein
MMGRRVDHDKSFATSTSVCITIVAGGVHQLQGKHVYRLVFYSIPLPLPTKVELCIGCFFSFRKLQHISKKDHTVLLWGVLSNLRGN